MKERSGDQIGHGGMGEAFLSENGETVEKRFKPTPLLNELYSILYLTRLPHAYSPDNPWLPLTINAVAQRRHLGAMLSQVFPGSVEMLDAEATEGGLVMPYIEGRPLEHEDVKIQEDLDKMAKLFREMGMTDWNFRGFFGLIGWKFLKYLKGGFPNVQVLSEKGAMVIDNEEGLPFFDKDYGGIRLGDVCYPTWRQGLEANKDKIVAALGLSKYILMDRIAKVEERYWTTFRNRENSPVVRMQAVIRALKPAYLLETVDQLIEKNILSEKEADGLKAEVENLPDFGERFKKIQSHLVAHNLTRLLPHGISSLTRLAYALGLRGVDKLKGNQDTIHTKLVAAISVMPTIGGFAYLLNLLPTENPEMTRLFLESMAYHGFHTDLDHLVEIVGKRSSTRQKVTRIKKTIGMVPRFREEFKGLLEEQFGAELINQLMEGLETVVNKESEISDDFPTAVYRENMTYFIGWGNKTVMIADRDTEKVWEASTEEKDEILSFLRQVDINACEDFEKAMLQM